MIFKNMTDFLLKTLAYTARALLHWVYWVSSRYQQPSLLLVKYAIIYLKTKLQLKNI